MATEQDTSETDAALRPQTPAARRRNPAAARQRTPEERERLRAESRARRQARENGHQPGPPEPPEEQITVRRLSESERAPSVTPTNQRPAPATPAAAATVTTPLPADPEPLEDDAAEEAAGAEGDALAEDALEEEALLEDDAFAREAFGGGAVAEALDHHAPPPPGQLVGLPRLPTDPRERGIVLLAFASALGIVIALVASISSGGLPGFGGAGMRLEAQSKAVAPGGWVHVTGKDAPAGAELVLESRSGGRPWRGFGEGSADGDGNFDLRGRLLERPGRIEVRARAPKAGAIATPVALTVRPLRLAAVGDINLDDVPASPWASVGTALRKADLAFGNLESAVSNRGAPVVKQYTFRGTPASLAALKRQSGLDVLNLANNHVGDYGPEATLDTVRSVQRLGMKAVGAGPDLDRALKPQIVKRLGLRVAFVGFSEIAPIEFAAGEDTPGTAWADPEAIAGAVQAARRKADVVVATFHWGIERQTLETAQQRALADVAVRAGAQVVIGAHPHTLQPVRRQGGAIVAYSLGNFVFAAQSPETTTTGILELGLTAEGVTKANWRPATIQDGRPLLEDRRPKRIPLRDALAMEAGVNLF
jgi:poly-gamma-glutamate capsule biosynthesis protein CapA/YwtB (metallophosphatase superfamily)